jgi:hypothetical protein
MICLTIFGGDNPKRVRAAGSSASGVEALVSSLLYRPDRELRTVWAVGGYLGRVVVRKEGAPAARVINREDAAFLAEEPDRLEALLRLVHRRRGYVRDERNFMCVCPHMARNT